MYHKNIKMKKSELREIIKEELRGIYKSKPITGKGPFQISAVLSGDIAELMMEAKDKLLEKYKGKFLGKRVRMEGSQVGKDEGIVTDLELKYKDPNQFMLMVYLDGEYEAELGYLRDKITIIE